MKRLGRFSFVFCAASALALHAFADGEAKRQIGQMVLDGVPEWSDSARERMLQYLEVRRAGLRDISDDGTSVLIGTRFANTNQIHLVSAPLGDRKQITFFDEPAAGGKFIPGSGGKRLVFRKDKGGDERHQVHILDLAGGKSTMLTDGKSRNSGVAVSKSGRFLAFGGTARNEKDFDVYIVDLQGDSRPKMVWQVEGQYTPTEFSPDESKLLVQHYLSERETHWYVYDVATSQQARLTPESPALFYGSAAWSTDGKAVYLTSDRDGEFRKLYRLDMEYGKWQLLTADINWDVDEMAVDPAGKGIAFVTNEDGLSKLYFADAWGGGRKLVDSIPQSVLGGLTFAAKGGVIGLTISSPQIPSDVFSITFPEGKLTRWTESEAGGLDPAGFVNPSVIRYPTFDQLEGKPRQIPAIYYKPQTPGPHPVVILVHGGPEGQERPSFIGNVQYWVKEMGIAVIAPNVRGSTGYGRSYHQLDNDIKREDSVKDIGALLDWIGSQKELDSKRVGIYGGSYGGYMVLGSLTNFPDRFKAGIDIVGITSFISFLETTPEFRRDLRRAEYGDERKPDIRAVLEKISPMKNAEKIKASLFVAHGKNDPRVPYTEAEQIVAKVRALGRPVWYALALNEGHGFGKRENSDLAAVMYALFWEKHLLN